MSHITRRTKVRAAIDLDAAECFVVLKGASGLSQQPRRVPQAPPPHHLQTSALRIRSGANEGQRGGDQQVGRIPLVAIDRISGQNVTEANAEPLAQNSTVEREPLLA